MTQQQIEEAVVGYEKLKERVANLEKEVEILKDRTNSYEIDDEGNVTIVN